MICTGSRKQLVHHHPFAASDSPPNYLHCSLSSPFLHLPLMEAQERMLKSRHEALFHSLSSPAFFILSVSPPGVDGRRRNE